MSSPGALAEGVRAGDRVAIGRAITLVESRRPSDREDKRELLEQLLPHTGKSHRVGITGAPGVGKSTFIEALGKHLTGSGHRVGVLAVDPSSSRSGGSILGDKTRMQELARDPGAFIRPSPSGGALGGVARHTRETMLVLESAGFDIMLVETVGVGQSEAAVANMVDSFVVLQLGGSGDGLQGIKRGILELVDLLAVTKADGDNMAAATRACADYSAALTLMVPRSSSWIPQVMTCSAVTGAGISELWTHLQAHRAAVEGAGEWSPRRQAQRVAWMWQVLEAGLSDALRADKQVADRLKAVQAQVEAGEISPDHAAEDLLATFRA
jgi:LAO/AO transport system kinase